MNKRLKNERDKEINSLILRSLRHRPLSPRQILDKIQEQKDEKE